MPGILFVVGTPIGNLGDLSRRARETLARCRSSPPRTRAAPAACSAGIDVRAPMLSFFEGNERQRSPQIVHRLLEGEDVALVTDGGMPGVSDPGFGWCAPPPPRASRSVWCRGRRRCSRRSSLSGLPTDRFAFEGFLPQGREASGAHGSRRSRTIRARSCSSSRPVACSLLRDLLAPWATGRWRLPRAHEAARGGAARHRARRCLRGSTASTLRARCRRIGGRDRRRRTGDMQRRSSRRRSARCRRHAQARGRP